MYTPRRRPKTEKPSPLRRLGRGLYRALVVLSVLIVGLWLALKLTSRRPTVSEPPVMPSTAPIAVGADAAAQTGDAAPQPPILERKDATWTFLIAAEDQVSGNTDTIMACTYDTANQKMGLVSIPRDTLVDRPGWRYHKINAAYPNGNIAYPPDGGIRELQNAVSEVLGIPMDHYVLVDTRLFVELVDAVGGVDFNVPVYMSYDAPDQDLHIHFQPGMQHLTGQQALEVVRCRKNSDGPGEYPNNIYDAYPDADIGRTRTQQEMVKAIAKKVLANPQKVAGYVQLLSKYVDTDLTLGNLLWFMEPALKFDFDDLTTATLPGNGNVSYKGTSSVYQLDIDGSLSLINQCLNPYTTDVTRSMVRMVRAN